MRFDKIKIHGLGPFSGTAEIDLRGLSGKIIAVCGENGSGKSTLLELLVGALYRECPTRGSLAGLAIARDSYVEERVIKGRPYTVRQMIDAHTGKGESVVLDESGAPVLSSAKVREYDQWAAAHLTPPEVLYASSFSVQGSRGFLDMSPAERKSVLLRVLGIERYERMAERARNIAREAKGAVDVLRARLDDEKRRTRPVEGARAALAAAEQDSTTATAQLRTARVALERAVRAAEDATRAREIAEQRRQVQDRIGTAQRELADAVSRIGNNRNLLGRAEEIRAAEQRAKALDEQLVVERAAVGDRRRDLDQAEASVTAAREALSRAQKARQEADSRAARARERLRDREDVERATASIDRCRGELQRAEIDLSGIIAERDKLSVELINSKDNRIIVLRSYLQEIACDRALPPNTCASDAIDEDDRLAHAAEEAPRQIAELKTRAHAAEEKVRADRTALASCERLAARAGEIRAAQSEYDEAIIARAAADDYAINAESNKRASEQLAHESQSRLKDIIQSISVTELERNGLLPLLALAPRIEQAHARIEELERQIEQSRGRLLAAETELAALPDVETATVDLASYERAVATAEASEREARDRSARASKALEDAQAGAERIQALQSELAAGEADLSDWVRLGQDFGKDGLQALEIDAAGPELNELANDLLHTCHGSRFTVEVATARLAADGKRMLEGLDVRVLDSEQGRDALAETYSGGECVIVGEAISLALTMIACRRNGVERPTIIRDESGAALDPANGRAYIQMLRRAAELIASDKVLFISHTPELRDMADARIEIHNGEITIQ